MPDPNLDDHARRRLRAIGAAMRRARGSMTQTEVGALLDLPQSTVSRYELGLVDFPVETIRNIELALGLADGDLLKAGGYVRGEAMPGNRVGFLSTDALDSVQSLIETADIMGWGVKVTNRVVPSDHVSGAYITEWDVQLHDQVPGAP